MSFAFRQRNLSCFYCGSRSGQKWNGGAQEWSCKSCEAVNYLDTKGQITEPPPQSTPLSNKQVRYAHPTSKSLSEDFSSSDEIFCSDCLKNQHIVKENLASYLPPEDDADYGEYITRYESYREQLEHRYPQVCPDCAPRVREQIRKASYVAKTDHLRRMIDRTKTKTTGVLSSKSDLIASLGIKLGFLGARASALLQACWHGMELISPSSATANGLFPGEANLLFTEDDVVEQFVLKYQLQREHDICIFACCILGASLLTIWWNPRMRARQLQPGGRLQGLTQFYILQFMSLLTRAASFYYLNPPPQSLRVDVIRGIHAFMVVFMLSVTIISSRIVRLDTKPLFTFPIQSQPILPDVPQPEKKNQIRSNTQTTGASSFPINKLATAPLSSRRSQNPSTPPPEDEYDADKMDWTPSTKPSALSLNPQPRAPQIPNAFEGPSPFYGTLPPAPTAPSHKLRNPDAYQPGTFRKASEIQQTAFATNISTPVRRSTRKIPTKSAKVTTNPYDSDGTDLTNDDDASVAGLDIFPQRRKKHDMELSQPKFFLQEDQRDTGLEDMFNTTFGLQDTPREIGSKRDKTAQSQPQSSGWLGWNRRKAEGS